MTAPDIFDDVDVDETDSTDETPATENKPQSDDNDKVTLKCPHSMTSLSHPEGLFPTVTRAGTEMTKAQAVEAKKAAKAARKNLITVGGRNK